MFSHFFSLCFFITVKTSAVNEIQVQTVRQGLSVAIKCGQNIVQDRKNPQHFFVWYKMSLGKVPQYIMRTFEDSTKYRFARAFENGHFTVSVSEVMFDLIINDVSEDDIGTYFCGTVKANVVEFGSGTLLLFQAEKIKWQLQTEMVFKDREYSTVQCSLQAVTESCSGEHSVYWFRHGSNKSRPEIIYTHGNRSDQCKTDSDAGSPTWTCVYDLPRRYTNYSDGGTYYCAVAACGEIFFGNGTKVDVEENNRWIVTALIICNVSSVIIIMALCGLLYKNHQKGSVNGQSSPSNKVEDTDGLNYAALRFAQKPSSSGISRVKDNSDVYARVRIQ
ncbi:uncharacterized protein LOC113568807 [Electrophorus electricus]|uniref:uncharacterized protein LOC113568807 n=1 Tax=Electrophorus electricus TaxID=8005 RepID=UPI0015D05B87|nr:uncharacterized protein LOC113568807 [Electrophorus electricus]